MLKSGIYDLVICRGGTDMCFVLGFGRKRPDLKQYRISGLTVTCYDFQQGMRVPTVPLNLHQDLGHSGWRWKSTSFRIIITLVPAKLTTCSVRHPEDKTLSNRVDFKEFKQWT